MKNKTEVRLVIITVSKNYRMMFKERIYLI